MSANELPRHGATATGPELANLSVNNLGDLLDTIRDGLLVVAEDVSEEQRQEINRELSLMYVMNDKTREALGLSNVPRSIHLQRGGAA